MNSDVFKRIFIGMILILIGTLFLGSQLGIITVNPGELASTYWPVIMIFVGAASIIVQVINRKEMGSSFMWNLFVIALGVGFLANNLNWLNMSTGEYIKLLIPGFIIIFGISMMFKKDRPAKVKQDYSNKYEYNYEYSNPPENANSEFTQDPAMPYPEPVINGIPIPNSAPRSKPNFDHSHSTNHFYNPSAENRSGFFGDLYLGHDYWELKPMNISHFIGDTIIDLTKAQIPIGDTKLNISAFIGDVKVFVPNDMEVEVSVTSSSFLGDSTVFNKRESGFMRSLKEESQDFTISDKKIRLQVNLFIGDITVQRVG